MSYDLKQPAPAAAAVVSAASLLAVASLVALAALTACGKEGPPTPPLRQVPAPTKDLAAHQRGTHVLLSFRYPQTTPGGQALGGVSKIEVYDAEVPAAPPPAAGKTRNPPPAPPASKPGAGGTATTSLPAAAPGTATAPAGTARAPGTATTPAGTASATGATAATPGSNAAPGGTTPTTAGAPASAVLSQPEALDPRQLAKLAKLRLTLTSKDLGTATLGNLLLVDLPLSGPLPATASAAPLHDYTVRAYGPKGDRSELSNQAMLRPKAPPHPPEAVTATGQADGVQVEWKPVAEAGSFAIYRRAASERFSARPLAVAQPTATRFVDTSARFGQSYIYSVTAVDAKEPLVESGIGSEIEIHYVDRYPPPVPEDLVVVAETARARLVWRQSEASDLAGYHVYRKGAGGDFTRLTDKPIAATSYVDGTAASGQSYEYRVTAIDQAGNESAPGAAVRVAVP